MKVEDANRQWHLCPYCGKEMTANPRVVQKLLAEGKTQEEAEAFALKEVYLWCAGCAKQVPKTVYMAYQEPPLVPFEQLEHGAYYHGTCRNAHVARWNAEKQQFVHWRTKFGDTYTEFIGYWIDAKPGEDRFDEFKPFGKMENPPFEIPLDGE